MDSSVFDYIITTTNNFWISNNVISDIEKGDLYISSKMDAVENIGYSLAVYAIVNSIEDNTYGKETHGILTFESPDVNAFKRRESLSLMEFLTELIYEIFNEIQK